MEAGTEMPDVTTEEAPERESLPSTSLAAYVAPPDPNMALVEYQTANAVAQSRIMRKAAVEIANTSWGKGISPQARSAIAHWALEAGVDPVRHIFILGGNIYDAAELYIDKLAADPTFIKDEVILLAPLSNVNVEKLNLSDAGKKQFKKDEQATNAKRLALQVEHGVPPGINDNPLTAAAALVRLTFRTPDGEIIIAEGVNWAGDRGQKKKDPVGEEHPVKTAVTRAVRKAAKKQIPVWFKTGDLEGEFSRASAKLAIGRSLPAEDKAEATQIAAGAAIVPGSGGKGVRMSDDPYEEVTDDAGVGEDVEAVPEVAQGCPETAESPDADIVRGGPEADEEEAIRAEDAKFAGE